MHTHMVQHWRSHLLAYPFGSAPVVLLACVSSWFPACLCTPLVQPRQSCLLAYPFGSPPACVPLRFSTGSPACLHIHLVPPPACVTLQFRSGTPRPHAYPSDLCLHVYPFGSALAVLAACIPIWFGTGGPACLRTHLVQHWWSCLLAYPFGSLPTCPALI
jgi:hypothetical protein